MTLLRFSRGSGLAGAVVRWATWSWCAHVGFKLDNGQVLDATPEFGVAIRDAVDDDNTLYFCALAPARHVDMALEWAKKQVGRPYDWKAIFGMAARRDWHREDEWFCSELVAEAFARSHWPLLRNQRAYDRITPRDLLLSTRIYPVQQVET